MRYTIHQSKVNNGTKGKFYLRPVYDETVGLDELAEHMASHNSPLLEGSAACHPHGHRGLHQGAVSGEQVGKDRRTGHLRGSRTFEGCEDAAGV